MNDISPPVQSIKSLIKSLVIALVLAVVVLLGAILPAEFGLDPTGLGQRMGLLKLSAPLEQKNLPALAACEENAAIQEHSVQIMVPAGGGIEYKLHIEKGEVLEYSWLSEGGPLYYDFHGEPQDDTTGYFKSFKESTASKDSGSQVMPFLGSHGWYWKNETSSVIKVALKTKGVYQVIGLR